MHDINLIIGQFKVILSLPSPHHNVRDRGAVISHTTKWSVAVPSSLHIYCTLMHTHTTLYTFILPLIQIVVSFPSPFLYQITQDGHHLAGAPEVSSTHTVTHPVKICQPKHTALCTWCTMFNLPTFSVICSFPLYLIASGAV